MSAEPSRVTRATMCALWIDVLYDRLATAETRAADPSAPQPIRQASAATARWAAAQIIRYEAELTRLGPPTPP